MIRDLLFEIIRSVVCGCEAPELSLLGATELKALYELARAQDMAHIVGFALEGVELPAECDEVKKAFSKQYMMAIYRYQHLTYEYKRICRALEQNKIKYIPLKGSVIRAHYPKSWMRTSCDIDILVPECELDSARDALVAELKYTSAGARAYHDISLYAPSGVHLELHFNIRENTEPMDGVLDLVWEHSRLVDGEFGYRQTDEFLMFHQIAHAAYHFTRGGCGLRPMLDIWLLRSSLSLDGEALEALLAPAGLSLFGQAVFALSDVWYSDAPHSELTRQMEDYILGAGIYGSTENRVAVSRANNQGRLSYLLSRIFMPYRQMKNRFPVLQKCPLLLPFCHVVRWFGLLSPKKRENARLELKYNSEIDGNKADALGGMLRQLGFNENNGEKG